MMPMQSFLPSPQMNHIVLIASSFILCYLTNYCCRYFLEPKAALMSYLEEVVNAADAELKSAGTARASLASTQESLAKEMNELLASLRKS